MSQLTFGTAGIRAHVGPGSDRMNVGTVTRATAGVAEWLRTHRSALSPDGVFRIAVGFDARYGSHAFARATAETFAGAGFDVTLNAEPAPTPVLAWLVRSRNFDAGVQITASHNPAEDNGYKLYLAGGAQIVSPVDREIEQCINAQPTDPAHIPRSEAKNLDMSVVSGYVTAISSLVATGEQRVLAPRRKLKILYTPLHGVGGNAMEWALRLNGFGNVHCVPSQRWPDPTFPTVSFPNPEEPGATDALLAEAREVGADLLIALDPDADRCMLGIHDGDYRMLRGDETGPLLAKYVLRRLVASGIKPVVATTAVSSQLLGRMARAEGWDYVETLTGFKHLARAADHRPGELAFAYEEAIGTAPTPWLVADKDGIATALIAAAWAAELSEQGRSLADELADIEETYGVFRTAQVSVRTGSRAEVEKLIAQCAEQPPEALGDVPVTVGPLTDSTGNTGAGVRLTGSTDAVAVRVIARASGTETKAKFYVEVSGSDRAEVEQVLNRVIADVNELTYH
ncbi:phospho-sugar mutase [Corynebacterium falsenii]|uniref:phospho-sugar mutase n=1 Tax=Corynebacterium falsenii TaxID=108486 RepID=UPI00234CC52A|nr:phospho-sugar mutase [Corynebacterium falsenii]MDC7103036.1 phospho-sugar mutase [Corynebacterium falsenii]